MLTLRLSSDLEERLARFAQKTERSKSYVLKKALERYLEEEEDLADALLAYEQHIRSGEKGYTLPQLLSQNELD